jgi:archaellum component FlaF (FlaF/FlaG flagellin family)
MEKNSFQKAFEKIEVPKDEVLEAIKLGKHRASQSTYKDRRDAKKVVYSGVAAATIILSSTFISPSISYVMAEVPLLGRVYESFNDAIGRSLQSQNLITAINEKASTRGIDVSITNAYYDGAVVGVTFNVKGRMKTEENGQVVGFYEIFDGDEGISDSKELVYMEPTDDGYVGHIQLYYPKADLPSESTFPLEFKRIGEKEGSWRFNVPITQLSYETVKINEETSEEFSDVKVHFDSIIAGKASTAINYTAIFPIEGKNDQVRLEIYDNKGEQVNTSMDGIALETIEENDKVIVKGRSIIPQSLLGVTSYLEVHPKVAITQKDQFVPLNAVIPVEIKADRQNLAVNIEDINVDGDSLTVNFQVNNGDEMGWDFNFYKDFARTSVIMVKESEKEMYKEPIKHSVKTINKDKLRFSSTFDISKLDDFSINEYVIRVQMGNLSGNIPVDLGTVKLKMN